MSDIDERLEEEILHAFRKSFDSQQAGINANFLMDIQREIERLRDELAAVTEERDRMREALRPFAEEADEWSDCVPADEHPMIIAEADIPHREPEPAKFTVNDLRRARATRAALGETDGN